MHIRMLVICCVLLAATPPAGTRASQAQGTELVCVGLGGDQLSLAEWTADEIRDSETQTGRPVLRVNPQTGSCYEPGGLPVQIREAKSVAFVCERDAEGKWYGPVWIYAIYRSRTAVAPDPSSGGCPEPRSSTLFYRQTELEKAAAIATYMSTLEANGEYGVLYQWMHPDSQALVSPEAVAGWYADEWAPRGPQIIHVDRVSIVDWTWAVTGKRYPSTAEIAFHQSFADGTEANDVVRLVRDEGVWRWFFGRDQAFVDDANARYGQ